MIISHRHKVCFWKIPRTGSNTVEMLIRLLARLPERMDVIAGSNFYRSSQNMDGVPDAPPIPGARRSHMTPETAIALGLLTQQQYDTYQNFCIIRDPLDRLISTHALVFPQDKFDANQLIGSRLRPNAAGAMYRAQTEYTKLGNMTALPFSQFGKSCRAILRAFKAKPPNKLPRITHRRAGWEKFVKGIATPADEAALRAFYKDDYTLHDQLEAALPPPVQPTP